MKKKITIEFNPYQEMMNVVLDKHSVFYGNYWDFDQSPHGLQDFLKSLNLEVSLQEIPTDEDGDPIDKKW